MKANVLIPLFGGVAMVVAIGSIAVSKKALAAERSAVTCSISYASDFQDTVPKKKRKPMDKRMKRDSTTRWNHGKDSLPAKNRKYMPARRDTVSRPPM